MQILKSIDNFKKNFLALFNSYTLKEKDSFQNFKNAFGSYFSLVTTDKPSSWIYDCLDIYGKAFLKTQFKLFDKGTYQQDKVKEVYKHPIIDIFKRPNQYQTWKTILYNTAFNFGYNGNAYLHKWRDKMGVVRQLFHIHPGAVNIISQESLIDYYMINTGREIINILPSDIIHIQNPNPDNYVLGKAIISNILDQSEVDKLQTAYQKAFYKNGGFLGLTFTSDSTISDKSFERAEGQLKDAYGGVDNAFNIALLDNGLKPVNVSHTMKDMDIRSQRELTRDEILAAFQINKFQLGMSEGTQRGNARENAQRFISDVIDPYLMIIADALTNQLCQNERGWESYFIEHVSISPRDLANDLQWYKVMTEIGGITPELVFQMEKVEIPANLVSDERMKIPLAFQKQIKIDNSNSNNPIPDGQNSNQ